MSREPRRARSRERSPERVWSREKVLERGWSGERVLEKAWSRERSPVRACSRERVLERAWSRERSGWNSQCPRSGCPLDSVKQFSKNLPSGPILSIVEMSVCLFVCPSQFLTPFNILFAPTSRSLMSKRFRFLESLGEK